jgi:hypothetical protein
MYTYGTGLSEDGWAFFGTVGYRWANMSTAAIKGTFYNSFSYFMALQKVFNEKHSLNLATWGNPTERATAGASTSRFVLAFGNADPNAIGSVVASQPKTQLPVYNLQGIPVSSPAKGIYIRDGKKFIK